MKKHLLGILAAVFVISSQAHAAITLPAASAFANADVETLVGSILAGLAVMWGARKLIKTTNKS